jgi:hypothetical protein
VIGNALLWVQDIAAGGGLEYAFWATIPWGIGLLIHALVFVFAGRKEDQAIGDLVTEKAPDKELQHH